jgi:hypothetical protein
VPQLVPAVLLLVLSTHVTAPVVHAVVPILQAPGLPVQVFPGVQAMQEPLPLQTRFVPQLVPPALLVPSMQVIAPVEQVVMPVLQVVGLPLHDWPAVQATHEPAPLQTMLVPQLTPGALALPSLQVIAPVAQDVVPLMQMFGLPVHDVPAVHDTQPPEPLQTMLAPQLVPAAFALPFTHVDEPVEHDATPL